MFKVNFLEEANLIREEIISNRRYFHQYPEVGFEEINTSNKIKDYLDSLGIPYESMAKTGIVAIIKGELGEGSVIALRSDLDALPIQDKKMCKYSSKVDGKMHACGHDGHMSILMGAAKILNKYKNMFKGCVKLIFEPAEETVGGAQFMIEEGALLNPKVDAIVGLHVSELIDSGYIGMKYGVVNAASNPFKIVIKGRGGHGAHPEDCVDPVVAACNIVTSLQTIISRELSPHNPAVLTVGMINAGTAPNIIPEEVVLEGVIRTMKIEDREYAVNRLKEICTGIASAMRVNVEFDIVDGYPCLYNNDRMVSYCEKIFTKTIGEEKILKDITPSMGVESFAYFSQAIPSFFYFLGTKNKKRGIVHPAHGSLFDLEEDGLVVGAALQSSIAFNYLNDN